MGDNANKLSLNRYILVQENGPYSCKVNILRLFVIETNTNIDTDKCSIR